MENLQNQMMPELNVPYCMEIPVIDLSLEMGSEADRRKLIHQILKALHEYRSFQVINHGVPRKVTEDAIEVYKEIFNLSSDEMDEITDSKKPWIYINTENGTDANRFLNDTLRHDCHPLEQTIDSWPQKPQRYRDVIGEYVIGTKKVSQKILELIGEGLGIRKGYFDGEMSHEQILQVKYYSKKSSKDDHSGCWEHYDPNLITLINTNVGGLLLHKEEEEEEDHGQWFAVPPLPNAFFVITGMQLEIISNGKCKSLLHQVVRNAEVDRISIAVFIDSMNHTIIEPQISKEVITRRYKAVTHAELTHKFREKLSQGESAASAGELALASFLA